jgi:hypothetical protein
MNVLLLSLPLTGRLADYSSGIDSSGILSSMINKSTTVIIASIIVSILIYFGLYIYLSLAYSRIGKKAGLGSPGIAWMPFLGKLAVIFECSRMHWWPFLMLTIGTFFGCLLVMSSWFTSSLGILFYLGLIVLIATIITLLVMITIWQWKTYQAVKKPGWWALVPVLSGIFGYIIEIIGAFLGISIISIIGLIIMILGTIAHLVFVGIAAWSENEG